MMVKIIADIAKQRKANLVLQRTDFVLFDRSFDVTDEVMQKLDEELPVLNVNFATPEPSATGAAPAAACPALRRCSDPRHRPHRQGEKAVGLAAP